MIETEPAVFTIKRNAKKYLADAITLGYCVKLDVFENDSGETRWVVAPTKHW